MEYQKIINLFDNTPNQPTKFKKKNLVEIKDDVNTNSQKKITPIVKSNLKVQC